MLLQIWMHKIGLINKLTGTHITHTQTTHTAFSMYLCGQTELLQKDTKVSYNMIVLCMSKNTLTKKTDSLTPHVLHNLHVVNLASSIAPT